MSLVKGRGLRCSLGHSINGLLIFGFRSAAELVYECARNGIAKRTSRRFESEFSIELSKLIEFLKSGSRINIYPNSLHFINKASHTDF